MDRRRFLGTAAASSLALALRPARLAAAATRDAHLVFDPGDDCALRESLAGWATTGAGLAGTEDAAIAGCALVVLPGVGSLSPGLARLLARAARDGATVVVESGVAFADDAAFALHRDILRARLGVEVASPLSLWPRPRGGIPYVEYRWPVPARVRDFSRVVPVVARPDDAIIARVDGLPVALRRRVGAGTLLVLGSPLGPALGAGDAEARQWVATLLDRAPELSPLPPAGRRAGASSTIPCGSPRAGRG